MVARVGPTRRIRHALVALLMTQAVLLGGATASIADGGSAYKDLATGSDFRLRVAAALALGKSKDPNARPALEKALNDPTPAVRVAVAAGLGALGDAAAVPALKAALARETDPNGKSQIETTIKRLGGSTAKAKFLVAVGKLENKSGQNGSAIVPALRSATREKMAAVPGIEVIADGVDASATSKSRGLPCFTLDGNLVELAKKQSSEGVGYLARVEYLVRRVPDNAVKGTMGGFAEALADPKQIRGQSELTQLQVDAMSAAVERALKGVSPTLEAATK